MCSSGEAVARDIVQIHQSLGNIKRSLEFTLIKPLYSYFKTCYIIKSLLINK